MNKLECASGDPNIYFFFSHLQVFCDWAETISADSYLIPSASFAVVVLFKNCLPIVTKSYARVVQPALGLAKERKTDQLTKIIVVRVFVKNFKCKMCAYSNIPSKDFGKITSCSKKVLLLGAKIGWHSDVFCST